MVREAVQRTSLNTECKSILLEHAFKRLDCICVEFWTHFIYHKSTRGIERLRAKLDGILISNAIQKNDIIRDTAEYSIIKDELGSVKPNLEFNIFLRKIRAPAVFLSPTFYRNFRLIYFVVMLLV